MNRQEMEQRLRRDARRIDATCSDNPRQRVLRRLPGVSRPRAVTAAWPWALAGAAAVLVLTPVLIYMASSGPPGAPGATPGGVESPRPVPVLADHTLARHEQLLRTELTALEADWKHLRALVEKAVEPRDGA